LEWRKYNHQNKYKATTFAKFLRILFFIKLRGIALVDLVARLLIYGGHLALERGAVLLRSSKLLPGR